LTKDGSGEKWVSNALLVLFRFMLEMSGRDISEISGEPSVFSKISELLLPFFADGLGGLKVFLISCTIFFSI
jgi:hypothetical protein